MLKKRFFNHKKYEKNIIKLVINLNILNVFIFYIKEKK